MSRVKINKPAKAGPAKAGVLSSINRRKPAKACVDFFRPSVGRQEIAAVGKALKRGWLTSGPEAERFAEELADFLGVKYALATSSGTAALHLALLAAGVQPGDEVITSPYTYVATAEAISYCGARPVFADVEPGGYNIDPTAIESRVTSRTRAIVPVGVGGIPCRSDQIKKIARRFRLLVIEDGAHTLGASLQGKPIGRWADATAFSFYSTKNLTTGEGGMVVTDRAGWIKTMRLMSRHGVSKATWDRFGSRSWMYDVVERGYKYNISDLLAALGRAQLKRFPQLQKKRETITRWYQSELKKIAGLGFPPLPEGSTQAYHLLMVRLTDPRLIKRRDDILTELALRRIGVSVHFIPLHLMTYFKRLYRYQRGDFPHAEAAFRATMSLPFYPEMTKQMVLHVVSNLRSIIENNR